MSVFGYWKVRGIGTPIRFLMEYVGEKYEEVMYECGEAPDYSRDCWYKVKYSFGLDFPNLPYYFDDKVKISQSNAILRYLGRKYKLDGATDEEKIRIDLLLEEIADFRGAWIRLCYFDTDNFDVNKVGYMKNVVERLGGYEKYLGDNAFFAGDKLTMVDFPMYEVIDQHREFEPKLLDKFPKLNAYMSRFEALPALKTFLASDRFYKRPIYNKMAGFK